jgi:hypothetical protein
VAPVDLSAAKLGSGARFRKLSATLAARGARNPDALAAYIGRKNYGSAGMGRLSHGKTLANPDLGIYLSETAKDEQGLTLTCPECSYSGPANSFGANGASLDKSPSDLQTPAPGTGSVRSGAATTVGSGSDSHALSNTRRAVELAAGTLARWHPVQSPVDVIVARGDDGKAVIRHRQGGAQIAAIRKTDAGQWVATVNGQDLAPHSHQRTALMEAVGTWNKAVAAPLRPADAPLQPAPQQTELMAQYGIPAIRALATPATGASSGPRITMAAGDADSDDGTDGNGLNAKGQGIYKRLIAKGLKPAVALAFAKRSQNAKPGVFGKVSS